MSCDSFVRRCFKTGLPWWVRLRAYTLTASTCGWLSAMGARTVRRISYAASGLDGIGDCAIGDMRGSTLRRVSEIIIAGGQGWVQVSGTAGRQISATGETACPTKSHQVT